MPFIKNSKVCHFFKRKIACLVCFIFMCQLAMLARAEMPNKELTQAIELVAIDWPALHSSATLSPDVIHSWLPDRGIRFRYEVVRRVMGVSFLQQVIGEPVFISGPHSEELDYTNNSEFGHYNAVFLQKLYQQLKLLSEKTSLVRAIQPWYNAQLRDYMRLYWLAYEHAAYDQLTMDGYLAVIGRKPTTFEASGSYYLIDRYQAFQNVAKAQGYDMFEAATVPGFWVRRSIDGTAGDFYQLLSLLLTTLDPSFAEQNIPTDGTLPCVQRAQLIEDLRQCSGTDYSVADDELNRVYKELKMQASHSVDFLEKLKVSQRAWIKLKQADLALVHSQLFRQQAGDTENTATIEHAEKNTTLLDPATELTLERVAVLKYWLAQITPIAKLTKAQNDSGGSDAGHSIRWKQTLDVAQYQGADWKNEVARKTAISLAEAKAYAASSSEISYFFFVKGASLHLPGRGIFSAGDAVFFSGKPWYGEAKGYADGYEKP